MLKKYKLNMVFVVVLFGAQLLSGAANAGIHEVLDAHYDFRGNILYRQPLEILLRGAETAGVNLEELNSRGQTILHVAVNRSSLAFATFLIINKKVNPHTEDKSGKHALHYAIAPVDMPDQALVELLIGTYKSHEVPASAIELAREKGKEARRVLEGAKEKIERARLRVRGAGIISRSSEEGGILWEAQALEQKVAISDLVLRKCGQ